MSKTTRIKADPDISTRAEFDAVLNDLATNQVLRDGLVLERDAKIMEIREEFDGEISEIDNRIKAAILRTEKYAAVHRDELFHKSKSAETALTIFGFRLGMPTLKLLNKKWTWDQVVSALKATGLHDLVVVKESADKDGMKARLSDEELARVGTRVDQTESFFVEPKRDAIANPRMVSEGKGVTA